ncbi:MAG: NAD(P)/FAD-dependent oxidoreductase [Patescibacteria group bacterium]
MKTTKTALIIGAGPAGLSAAYQLLKKSNIKPIIIEYCNQVGGISKTINHNGYLIDIGPHRFFSKSEIVNNFWSEILDKQNFLKIKRLTRIFYLKNYFNYPINLSISVAKILGPWRMIKIGFSYIKSQIKPIFPEKSLADFYTNRFGKELYNTFFKDYTYKVWGVSCDKIPPDWGSQRVKGLSITKVILHAISSMARKNNNIETSLIDEFYYPQFGAGQMYEKVAELIIKMGGEIRLEEEIVGINVNINDSITVVIQNNKNNKYSVTADYVISSMPIKNLISGMDDVPQEIKQIASGLIYRDYILVGLLFSKMAVSDKNKILPDNWLYIQENNIKMGRLDIVNNFSLKMLKDENNVWLGAEYFCDENDEFWSKNDLAIKDFALMELEKMKMINKSDFLDFKVIRQTKAYPAYFGSYVNFDKIKNYLNKFENLYLIGRNGMHKYNNMDHSILSGFTAANNIINNVKSKENIWEINTDEEYHESKTNN